MAKVTGIGGFFVRSPDPTALATWYGDALGVSFDGGAAVFPGSDDGGYSVLGLFGSSDSYIGDPARQSAMVNFRVDDLDGVLERLRRRGAVTESVTEEIYGRFSWTYDLDGNRVELWEPSSTGSLVEVATSSNDIASAPDGGVVSPSDAEI